MLPSGAVLMSDSSAEAIIQAYHDAYYQRTFGILVRLVGDWVEAKDLCQEVFARAARFVANNGEASEDRKNVPAWLARIAENLAIDHARKQGRRIRPKVSLDDTDAGVAEGLAASSPGPEFAAQESELFRRVTAEIDRLTVAEGDAVRAMLALPLRRPQEWEAKTPGAQRRLRHRARQKLRETLLPFLEEADESV